MIDIQKTIIEIQNFQGYPNFDEMINRVREVLKSPDMQIEYQEILIDTPEQTQKRKFRGSSTLLINGRDMKKLQDIMEERKNGE